MKSYKTTMYNENGETLLIHHSTAIIRHNHINKTVQLNNGGYFSKTTKDRMNTYFNENGLDQYGVFQKNFDWFVITPNNNHKNPLPYNNNMILEVTA
jgi:hypothetical protein